MQDPTAWPPRRYCNNKGGLRKKHTILKIVLEIKA